MDGRGVGLISEKGPVAGEGVGIAKVKPEIGELLVGDPGGVLPAGDQVGVLCFLGVVFEADFGGALKAGEGADQVDEIGDADGVAVAEVERIGGGSGVVVKEMEDGAGQIVDVDAVGDFFSAVDELVVRALKAAKQGAIGAVDADDAGDGEGEVGGLLEEKVLDVAAHLAEGGGGPAGGVFGDPLAVVIAVDGGGGKIEKVGRVGGSKGVKDAGDGLDVAGRFEGVCGGIVAMEGGDGIDEGGLGGEKGEIEVVGLHIEVEDVGANRLQEVAGVGVGGGGDHRDLGGASESGEALAGVPGAENKEGGKSHGREPVERNRGKKTGKKGCQGKKLVLPIKF